MPDDLKIKKIRGDLNIELSKDQINLVLKHVLGPKGENISNIAMVSDHCCVDASVGSSVAGPVSGVASSVSVPGPGGGVLVSRTTIGRHKMLQKITEKNLKFDLTLPQNINVK